MYPALNEPNLLVVAGPTLPDWKDCVVIAGSRSATPYGTSVAMTIAREAALRGKVVISGLAYGIDAAAHRAVVVESMRTMAVLPSGLDRVYPSAHASLAQDILDSGGWLVTEYPPGTTPTRTRFLRRNEVMAAMASHVIIVEASMRSGSMSMANRANAAGCKVGAVPGPVTSMTSEGTHHLIFTGQAELVTPDYLDEFFSS